MFNFDLQKILQIFEYNQGDPLLFGTSSFLITFFFLLVIYRLLSKYKNPRILFLIFFSLFFYYKAAGVYFLLLIFSAISNFYFGKWMAYYKKQTPRRLILLSSLILNLGLLGYFKYTNFFIKIVTDLSAGSFDPVDIFLPIGISFYTFKSLSYVLDIYFEAMEPTKSFRDFSLFVFFFPNILAGPIDRASQFLPQLEEEFFISKADIGRALLLIIAGLIKKNMIADYISLNFVDRVLGDPLRFTGTENLFAVYGYALQIYCDFSGYSDIAIGIGLLLGFKLMDNFNSPYQATSIADFWRRWHISLSSWLLDYLFRPLQMKFRNLRNYGNAIALLITFLLCGLWHGASWSFVLWGALHGFYMSFALLFQKPKNKFYKKIGLFNTKLLRVGQVFITFHLIVFTWIFFKVSDFDKAFNILDQIFNFFKPEVVPQFIESFTPTFVLIVFGYVLHFLPRSLELKTADQLSKLPFVIQALVLALVIWVVAQVQSADLQPFIYFQF
ncbi:MAG: MBOAT family protein [Bacteroidetes bacterium]|nr:MBOAT family protein [Bacteroidota bacterium]MBU1679893.1 MBOAT family protein [Bacteroidota bacterium]